MERTKLTTKINPIWEQGKHRAIRSGKHVLVSSVSEIKRMELSAFFSLPIGVDCRDRFFWSEPGRKLSFVGIGSVCKIEANDAQQRYQEVEQQWQQLLDDGFVEADIPKYTGPMLVGGFSFDPEKDPSSMWSDFPHTSFVVPKYMLTQVQGQAWLTTNIIVSPDPNVCDWEDVFDIDDIYHLDETKPRFSLSSSNRMMKEEYAPSEWMSAVRKAVSSIQAGELEKVVLARRMDLQAERTVDLEHTLTDLLMDQGNTYVFGIERGNSCFIGATPERLIKRSGDEFLTLSLAGSMARGNTSTEDDQLGDFLIKDNKNLHEHALAVQMIKGVMTELCEQVEGPDSPILFKLKDIQHLATPITGIACEGVSLLKAVERLHPTPALGGMPHEAAIEAIRSLENMDRGWYAAPIGWLDRDMDGEFVAAIRSALVRDNTAVLFAGCGIMKDSDPVSEYHETALKFRPMLSALQALDSEG